GLTAATNRHRKPPPQQLFYLAGKSVRHRPLPHGTGEQSGHSGAELSPTPVGNTPRHLEPIRGYVLEFSYQTHLSMPISQRSVSRQDRLVVSINARPA